MAKTTSKKDLVPVEPTGTSLAEFNHDTINSSVEKMRELVRSVIQIGINTEIADGKTKVIQGFIEQTTAKLEEINTKLQELFRKAEEAPNPVALKIQLTIIATQKAQYKEWFWAAVSIDPNAQVSREEIDSIVDEMFDTNIEKLSTKAFRKAS